MEIDESFQKRRFFAPFAVAMVRDCRLQLAFTKEIQPGAEIF
ncbi:MAG TPA: hypothetical protein VGF13_13790 [Verrucomicrobiae bacterium]|jgi:hypothetical protein